LIPIVAVIDTTGEDYAYDSGVVADLLDRLRDMQARCTCDRTSVLACPNYVPGDEEDSTPWE
jgi:hypothetical protein